jgi:hypothetical protein
MFNKRLFDRRYGRGAFDDRLRLMLDDPRFAYQHIANKFGVTRQYVAQLAARLGIDGMRRRGQRERLRMLHREPRVIRAEYPPAIRSVIDQIRRSGIPVRPYIFPPNQANVAWKSQKMVLVSGVLCAIQLRKGGTMSPNGREYARFDVKREVNRAKVALWATRSGRAVRVYVIPLTHLRNLSYVYLPVEGKYVTGGRKPRKDWTRYEGAWHLLRSVKIPARNGTRFKHDDRRRYSKAATADR